MQWRLPCEDRTMHKPGSQEARKVIQNQAGTVSYNIDQAGRDNQIGVLSMDSTTPLTTTYAFNDNEQMTGVALPNNVEQDAGYDGANRLTSLSAQNTANHSLLNNSYQYGYDPLGLTSAITTTVQGSPTAQTLTHDAAGRLTAVTGTAPTGSWSYDGRGNLSSATSNGTTTTYSYNTSNPEEVASTSSSGQPTTYYGYDGNGDTTSITNTSSLNRQLSYDAQTRLTQITFGSPITQTVVITYTVFGQRANYAVTPAGAGQPSLSEHFWYQGDQLSQVAYTGTSITTPYTDTYVYSQDGTPLELLRQMGSTTTPYWYVLDGQGNVVALTNQSGAVVDAYTYDQWGKPLTVSESVPQQLRYAGYWYDNELGWYWLSVRPYDPVLERFTQPDPSEIQGLFSYVYAGDSPSDLGDPSGLSVAIPLQSGTLVTPGPGSFFENNVAVGSDQWNIELGNGTKSAGGLVGANGRTLVPGNGQALTPSNAQALVPSICERSPRICAVSGRTNRTAGHTLAAHGFTAFDATPTPGPVDTPTPTPTPAPTGTPQPDRRKLLTTAGSIAKKFGYRIDQVEAAFHPGKNRQLGDTGEKNPDVAIDAKTGEIYPVLRDGTLGDSLGNIRVIIGDLPKKKGYKKGSSWSSVTVRAAVGAAVGGSAIGTIWVVGKLLSPACGLAAPVCVLVL